MLTVERARYRVVVDEERPLATVEDARGRPVLELALAADLDTLSALDVTTAVRIRSVIGDTVVVETSGGPWRRKTIRLECARDELVVRTEIEGDGALTTVRLLGGRSTAWRRLGAGRVRSRSRGAGLFSPSPSLPERVVQSASASAVIEASGASSPARGHWFFTPPPFLFAFADATPQDTLPAGPWASLALATEPGAHTFTSLEYDALEDGFSLALEYEGETRVRGAFTAPAVVVRLDAADPYDAIATHTAWLRERSLVPTQIAEPADWWARPIFCGWGAQCASADPPETAPAESRASRYDEWLDLLERKGLVPGTIVIDDKWQRAYGTCEADETKWPDLARWIARRHERGQRVLLWWKAWDAEGLDPEQCIRTADGTVIAADPTNAAYEATLRASVRRLVGRDGYDADGLKIDFTGQTPSGPRLRRRGRLWGIELLHRLLEIVYDEVKRTKPDALVVTHTANPYFADVTDMVRLNDVMRLYDHRAGAPLVEHMVHRARVARAALPEHLIETDNWALPDRATWRAYVSRQRELGVPSLYYATHIDRSGEALDETDYALVRRAWGAAT
ncbi:MAG TPA: hypothetical protein VI814_03680 [Candidatus Limnocylindria bacterium]